MSFPLLNPQNQFFDSSGSPLAGGTIEFKDPVTNAYINTYPTADDADAQTDANANPLTLNARGEAADGIYLEDGVKYRVILKDANGATVWDEDDVRCPVFSAASIGTSLYPQTSAESSAGVTPTNYQYEPGDVRRYGAVGDGVTDDTTAIQTAIDSITAGTYTTARKVTFGPDVYIITKPLEIGGDNLNIDGNNCTIRKTTDAVPATTHSNISTDIPGGAVNPNQNAVFTTTSRLRFSRIENLNLEGLSGTSTPIGIWAVGNENILRNINIRNVSVGLHVPSMWASLVERVVVRTTTGNGIWWDATRVSGSGQSGTSIHFSSCAVFAAGDTGFYLHDCDYVKFSACACDGSVGEAYYIRGCSGVSGNIAWEDRNASSTTVALQFASGSSGALVIDSYDDTNRALAAVALSDSIITLTGRLRTDEDTFFDLSTNSRLYADGLDIVPITGSVTTSRFTTDAGSTYYFEQLDCADSTAFTPSITIGGSSTGITYAGADGSYTRVRDRVHFDLVISLSSKNALSGAVLITDLPTTVADNLSGTTVEASAIVSQWSGMTTSVIDIKASVKSDGTIALYAVTAAATGMTALNGTDLSDTTALYVSGSYAT